MTESADNEETACGVEQPVDDGGDSELQQPPWKIRAFLPLDAGMMDEVAAGDKRRSLSMENWTNRIY